MIDVDDLKTAIDYLNDNISTLDDVIHDCTTHGQSQKDLDDAVVYGKQQVQMRKVVDFLGQTCKEMLRRASQPQAAPYVSPRDWGKMLSEYLDAAVGRAPAELSEIECTCDRKSLWINGCTCAYSKRKG